MATFSSDDVSLDTSGLVLGNTNANVAANSTTLTISSGLNLISGASGTNIGDIGILTEGGGWDFAGYQTNGFTFFGGTATPDIDGIILTTTANDPNFISPTISLNGGIYRFLKLEYERITHSTPPGWDGSIFYSTGGHGATETYKARAPGATGPGVRDSIYIDMGAAAGAPDWLISTITAIRFDFDSFPGGVVKIYSIKYYSMAQGSVFDGNTNQSSYACGIKYNANSAYVGKTLAASSVISKAVTYGANNVGYTSCDNVTLYLYGKTGSAPANSTNGTILGNTGLFQDTKSTNPLTIVSNDLTTKWDHAWVTIVPEEANVSLKMCELELYGAPTRLTMLTANGIVANGGVGSPGHVLTSNGSTQYWAAVTSTATPGGANTELQYNDSGSMGGNSVLTFNKTTGALRVGNSTFFVNVTSQSIKLANATSNTNIPIPTAAEWVATKYLHANGTWQTPAVAATPSGANTSIQYNDSGATGGAVGLVWDKSSNTVKITGNTHNNSVRIYSTGGVGPGIALDALAQSGNTWGIISGGTSAGAGAGHLGFWNEGLDQYRMIIEDTGELRVTPGPVYIGNNTTNAVANSTTLKLSNTTVNTQITIPTTVQYAGEYFLLANGSWALVNNALYLGGTAAAGYQTTAGLAANVLTLAANNASFLGGVAAASYATLSSPVFTTSVSVGANIVANTTAIFLGNTTVNLVANSTAIKLANSTSNTMLTVPSAADWAASKFLHANGTWQSITASPAGGDTQVQFNDLGAAAGSAGLTFNKTTNNIFIANTLTVGTGTVNTTNYSGTANNALNLGGTAAASYQLNSTLAANVATMTANNATWHGTSVFANSLGAYPTSNTVGAILGNTISRVIVTGNNATFSSTLAAGDTTVTGFVNATVSVNAAAIRSGTDFLANAVGAYHTGTMNASIFTTTGWLANTTGIVPTSNSSGQNFGNTLSRWVITANSATLSGDVSAAQHTSTNFVANSSGVYHTTTMNAASFTTTGLLANTTGIVPASNSSGQNLGNTISRWIITANSATLSGDISAAQHTSTNFVANSSGVYHTTTMNAASFTTSGFLANTTGVFPLSNSTGQTFGNTIARWVITANSLATTGQLANSLGLYPTSNTVGQLFGNTTSRWDIDANSVMVSAGVSPDSNTLGTALGTTTQRWVLIANTIESTGLANLNTLNVVGSTNTATMFAAQSFGIGANVGGNTTIMGVSNSTTAVLIGNNYVDIGNSTVNTFANSTLLRVANATANVILTPDRFFSGNSTVNLFANSVTLKLANSTVNTSIVVPTAAQYAGNYYLHANGTWALVSAGVTVSASAPGTPTNGSMWYDLTVGKFYVYVDDGTSSQWAEVSSDSSGGGGGATVTVSSTAPVAPTAGAMWYDLSIGKFFVYVDDGTSSQWSEVGGGTGETVVVSSTAPTSPGTGQMWYDLTVGKFYVYIDDGSSLQWVQVVGSGGDGGSVIGVPTIDETVPRFDGVAGLLQTSGVTIDDSDRMALRDGSATGTTAATSGTYTLRINQGNLTLGCDVANAYIQSWGGKPLVLNGQGNPVFIGSGQVQFPATQNASAGANVLDDYEEGTFTPAFFPSSGTFTTLTYANQLGSYTKIGRQVTLHVAIAVNVFTIGSGSGNLFISGTPFTAGATYGVGTGQPLCSAAWAGEEPFTVHINPSDSNIGIWYRTAVDGVEFRNQANDISAVGGYTTELQFTLVYHV